MCGCTNNTNGSNQCTILLIIIIFALQGLLNGSTQSKTALVLLFLYWLCGNNCNRNNAQSQCNTCAMPMNNCCRPISSCCMPTPCCCKSKKHRKHDSCTCKCERVKVCCNTGR